MSLVSSAMNKQSKHRNVLSWGRVFGGQRISTDLVLSASLCFNRKAFSHRFPPWLFPFRCCKVPTASPKLACSSRAHPLPPCGLDNRGCL